MQFLNVPNMVMKVWERVHGGCNKRGRVDMERRWKRLAIRETADRSAETAGGNLSGQSHAFRLVLLVLRGSIPDDEIEQLRLSSETMGD